MRTVKIVVAVAVILAAAVGFYVSAQKRTAETNRLHQEANVEKQKTDQRSAEAERTKSEQQSAKADLALLPPADAAPAVQPTAPKTPSR